MGSCKKYTAENMGTKCLQLMGIGGITQPFGYHIIKDHDGLSVEESGIKFYDIHFTETYS